jgi:hypothetical protein
LENIFHRAGFFFSVLASLPEQRLVALSCRKTTAAGKIFIFSGGSSDGKRFIPGEREV